MGGSWTAHWWLIGRLGSANWPEKRGSWPRDIPIPLSNVSAPPRMATLQKSEIAPKLPYSRLSTWYLSCYFTDVIRTYVKEVKNGSTIEGSFCISRCFHFVSLANNFNLGIHYACTNVTLPLAHRQIQDCFPPGCCKVSDKNRGPGGWPRVQRPLAGLQGGNPCVGKFCISELNLRDLVHTFYQHYIENLYIYFQ